MVNLGDAHRSLDQWTRAVECYEQAPDAEPDLGAALSNLVCALKTLCRWGDLAAREARLLALSDAAIAAGQVSPIDPFVAVVRTLGAKAFGDIQRSHAARHREQIEARAWPASIVMA